MMGDCQVQETSSAFRSAMLVQPSTSDGPQEIVIITRPNQVKEAVRPIHRHNTPRVNCQHHHHHHHHHHRRHRHHVIHAEEPPIDISRSSSNTIWSDTSDELPEEHQIPTTEREVEISQAIDSQLLLVRYTDSQLLLDAELPERKTHGRSINPRVINCLPETDTAGSRHEMRFNRALDLGASHVIFSWPDAFRHPPHTTRLLASTFRWASHALHLLATFHFIPRTVFEDVKLLPWKLRPPLPPRREHCTIIEPHW